MSDAIELTAGHYRAVVHPYGAALCALEYAGRDLVWGYDPGGAPAFSQGQLLLPWPNRIADGRYTFGGAEHRLPLNEPQRHNAIHGLVSDRMWRTVDAGPAAARFTVGIDAPAGYPFQVECTAAYALDPEQGLTLALGGRNTGAVPAPFGAGSHFYLTVGQVLDHTVLRLPAGRRLPVDERRLLPTGAPVPVAHPGDDFRDPRPLGAASFDTAFTDLRRGADGAAWTVLSGGGHAVGLWADAAYPWLQVFSSDPIEPHRGQLAVEPMTCPPNAFASGIDLITLEPGGSVSARLGVRDVAPLTPTR
ncbi:aldose 1-epimerase [Murinocardiopsis flavida]|uniref:Aldose 1-epimerase n=1 Tax=Murinocardiopsis flavida TaxID=645275 RepID=A0A2P8DHZ6_9ACTN|nr:aldose 1-epimerase family protein [Murinocardiopsis flavida]PSK96832.1 aldose 1-epimerase [Murinocardiopsis flavida]